MDFISSNGWVTANEIAERFQLTPAAVRRHLTQLVSDGLLQARTQPASKRHGAGRPSKQYAASSKARQSKGQDSLAVAALNALRQAAGAPAVVRFFEERFTLIEQRFLELSQADPAADRAEVLSRVLSEGGFIATAWPVPGGEQLCQHHCPYTAVAEQFPELCGVETKVFAKLLGSHIQRLATIAHGDGVCTTNIPMARQSVLGDGSINHPSLNLHRDQRKENR
jgi:predicted ArsR family transcriptional regulator